MFVQDHVTCLRLRCDTSSQLLLDTEQLLVLRIRHGSRDVHCVVNSMTAIHGHIVT